MTKAFIEVPTDLLREKLTRVQVAENGCIVWTGRAAPYAQLFFKYQGVRYYPCAHVVSWEIANGRAKPLNMQVMHSCDNPPCLNPEHLSLGTAQDNRDDCMRKGRESRGHLPGGTRLTEAEAREILDLKGVMLQRQVAAHYGVSLDHVKAIQGGRVWKRLFDSDLTC